MYTLHKLLKGGRKEERVKSSEFLTQKENEDIVNILASTRTGTFGGWGWVGGLCDSKWVREGQTSRASVSVFSQKNVQLGTNWDNCWPINILFTMKQIQSCNIQEPSTFQYVDSKHYFSGFSYTLVYMIFTGLCLLLTTLLLSEREQMHLSQPLSDKTICTVCSLPVLKPTDFNDNITAA